MKYFVLLFVAIRHFLFLMLPAARYTLHALLIVLFFPMPPVSAEEPDCLMCHEQLAKEKVVHPAVAMGCPSCHSAIDAKDIPHKKTSTVARGLSADQPELCYGCHDKAKFTKKTVHAAIGMGCTGCHNPHSSKNARLLMSDPPELCFNCHDRKMFEGKKTIHPPVMGGMCTSCHSPHSSDAPKLVLSEPPALCFTCHDQKKFTGKTTHAPVMGGMCTACHAPHQSDTEKLLASPPPDLCFTCHDKVEFSRTNVHMPVAGGMCLSCHKPHAGDNAALLVKSFNAVCLECHADVRKRPHAIAGFSQAGHPLGGYRKGKMLVDDPARQGKSFYCASCHNPHSSDSPRLFRYKASVSFELCVNCHKM